MVLVLLLWCAVCRLICGGGCRVKCHVLDIVHCVHVLDDLHWCLLITSIHASSHPESPLAFFRFLPQHVFKGVPASSLPVQMQERTCLSPPELSNGSICPLDGLCRQDKDEVCLECCPMQAPAARDMPATDMSLSITSSKDLGSRSERGLRTLTAQSAITIYCAQHTLALQNSCSHANSQTTCSQTRVKLMETLAREYHVSNSHVCDIWNRHTWAHHTKPFWRPSPPVERGGGRGGPAGGAARGGSVEGELYLVEAVIGERMGCVGISQQLVQQVLVHWMGYSIQVSLVIQLCVALSLVIQLCVAVLLFSCLLL